MLRYPFLFFIALIFADCARAEVPLFSQLGPQIRYSIDAGHTQTLDDIMAKSERDWLPVTQGEINFGFRTETFWFTLRLSECRPQDESRVLEIAYPLLDRIELWFVGRGPRQHYLTGDKFAFSHRPLIHKNFGFPYSCQQFDRVYIRVDSTSSIQLPLQIWSRSGFIRNELPEESPQFFYFGAVFVMVIYNFFLFLSVRNVSYLVYVLFTLSYGCFQAGLSGMGFRYLWSDLPALNNYAIDKPLNGITFFAFLFALIFLRARIYSPRLYRFGRYVLLILGLYSVISFLMPYRIAIKGTIFFAVMAILVSISMAFINIQRKRREGYFYGIAWMTFLLGALSLAFNKLGLLPRNNLTENALQIASILEMLLLSFALADQMNVLRAHLSRSNRQLETTLASIEQIVDQKTKSIRSIMETLKQGIVTIRGDAFTIEPEYSRYTEVLLDERNLSGRTLESIFLNRLNLGHDEQSLILSVLRASLDDDLDAFQVNSHHLPKEGQMWVGSELKDLVIDWTPVLGHGDRIECFLIAFHDVTELRDLKKKQAHQSQMLMRLHRMLSVDAASLRHFLIHSLQIMTEHQRLLALEPSGEDLVKRMFIDIHTIKGESRSLGLTEISEVCHDLEDCLDLVRKKKAQWDANAVEALVRGIQGIIGDFAKIHADHIGSLTGEREIAIRESVLEGWGAFVQSLSLADEAGRQQQSLILREIYQSVHIDLLSYEQKIRKWGRRLATELGKPEPHIVWRGENFFLSQHLVKLFDQVFVHILQNALVHGIEMPDERLALGKDPQGRLQVELVRKGPRVHVVVQDDGRGLDVRAIHRKAVQLGLLSEAEELSVRRLEEFLFRSGFSSKEDVSGHAGRGVGMDAARNFVQELAGRMSLRFDEERNGFVTFAIEVELPGKLFPSLSPYS